MRLTTWIFWGVLSLAVGGSLSGQQGAAQKAPKQVDTKKLPPLKRQVGPKAVVDEHLDALNHCDWERLIAQYPPEAEFFLPGGQLVKGREQVAELFGALVKPFNQGGLCGAKFEPVHSFLVGNTLSVQWRATADFLAEPYLGADAYITKDGLMWATVTTFQKDQLKTK
ncbi:MAG: hypothetical protein QOJ99_2384 [Bryobacterales bacterium]|jgi:hypothetical protein|nr:hypothetical protein [Bryobacterales bacterium]